MLDNVEKAGDAYLFLTGGRLEVRLEKGIPRGAMTVRIKHQQSGLAMAYSHTGRGLHYHGRWRA